MNLIVLIAISPTILFASRRIIFIFWGAILSFGTADLATEKYIYLAGLVLASGISILEKKDELTGKLLRKFAILPVLLSVTYGLNFVVAYNLGNNPVVIFRQLLPLFIFILGINPIIHCSVLADMKFLYINFILIGLFSALSTYIKWSQLHGGASYGIDRLGLDSDLLGLLALILILAPDYNWGKRILLRASVGIMILFLFIGTFSRSFIPSLLTIFCTSVFIYRRQIASKFLRFVPYFVGLFTSIILITKYSNFANSETFYRRYLTSFIKFRSGGLSDTGLGNDASLIMRKQQGELAMELWSRHKIFGSGILDPSITMDNIRGSFATNGSLGAVILVIFFCVFFASVIGIHRPMDSSRFLAINYIFLLCIYSFLGNWPTNKSAWLGILMILSLYCAQSKSDVGKDAGVHSQ